MKKILFKDEVWAIVTARRTQNLSKKKYCQNKRERINFVYLRS